MGDRIVVVDLAKSYGARVALEGVGFSVAAGEIVGLLGPNGAGKTTTLSILATLLPPDRGRVSIAGHSLPADSRQARGEIGLVPQQTAVYPSLTARENLLFFGRMQGLGKTAAEEASRWALSLVALENRADEPVAGFSGGMKRRLNLACGILHRPKVLLLDEPTVGVDPQSRERIFEAVESLAREGAAALYSTHSMEEAERMCGRVILLDSGHVAAQGTTAELITRSGLSPVVTLRSTKMPPPGWLDGIDGARQLEARGHELAVAVREAATVPAILQALARAGGSVLELELRTPSLADVFFQLTGRGLRDENGGGAAAT